MEQARRHAGAQRMQLHFGKSSFQAEQQAAIRGGRIIDAVTVSNQTALVATDVEQRIPIRAIARQAGHFRGENDADLAERNLSDQILEAWAMVGGSAR